MNNKTEYGLLPLNKGSNSKVNHIFINGFMTDEDADVLACDWQSGLKDFVKPSDNQYIFRWESSFDYLKLRNHIPFKNGFKNEMKKIKHIVGSSFTISKLSPLVMASRLNPLLILPTSFSSFCLEEWKISKENSIKYGISLAEEINTQKIKNNKIFLYAHSLGVNLVKTALLELYQQNIFVEKVFLFGGASCSKEIDDWAKISQTTNKGIYNFYSKHDAILKYIYKIAELRNSPVGLNPIIVEDNNKIFNIDVSNAVNGHAEYKKNLQHIFREVYFNIL